jgi:hypothetical protein
MRAEYALGVEKRIYVLKGHQAELDRFAGERVMARGRIVRRDTIAVESVVPWLVSTSRARIDAPAEKAFAYSKIAIRHSSISDLFRN